jgi:hypothetical protein
MTRPHDSFHPDLPAVASLLGWLGLIPFLGLPLLMWVWSQHTPLWSELLAGYALAIISFLAGVWWGLCLLRRYTGPLWLGNALVVISWIGHGALPASAFYWLAAAVLATQYGVEQRHPVFQRQPLYYRRLRARLSACATAGLVLAAWRLAA